MTAPKDRISKEEFEKGVISSESPLDENILNFLNNQKSTDEPAYSIEGIMKELYIKTDKIIFEIEKERFKVALDRLERERKIYKKDLQTIGKGGNLETITYYKAK
jgi:hypothetical protein